MPDGCGHGPDNGSADCGHDGDSGWGWSGGEATRDSTYRVPYQGKTPEQLKRESYLMLFGAVCVIAFLAWVLSPIYM